MALIDKCTASYLGNNMVGCAKKAVLRMEPKLKRSICKCCQTPLIPGETARVRLISKPTKRVKWTCLTCMNTKRFPVKEGYELWPDQPKAVIETLDYTPKPKNEIKKSDASEKIEEKEVIVRNLEIVN